MKTNPLLIIFTVATVVFAQHTQAQILAYSDFSTFSNGNLVGQQGWQQFGTNAVNPMQVANGVVVWDEINPSSTAVSGQDTVLFFNQSVSEPSTGTNTFFFAIRLAINSAQNNPSYIAGMSIIASTNPASGNFVNSRITAAADGTGFVFGTRVTGQTGYPWQYGTETLNYGQIYNVVARVNMVAGAQNDTIELFIDPPGADFDNYPVYAVSTYTTGPGTDPASYSTLILSQFANNTFGQNAVEIHRMLATTDANLAWQVIPEPTPAGLLLCTIGAYFLIRRITKPGALL